MSRASSAWCVAEAARREPAAGSTGTSGNSLMTLPTWSFSLIFSRSCLALESSAESLQGHVGRFGSAVYHKIDETVRRLCHPSHPSAHPSNPTEGVGVRLGFQGVTWWHRRWSFSSAADIDCRRNKSDSVRVVLFFVEGSVTDHRRRSWARRGFYFFDSQRRLRSTFVTQRSHSVSAVYRLLSQRCRQ